MRSWSFVPNAPCMLRGELEVRMERSWALEPSGQSEAVCIPWEQCTRWDFSMATVGSQEEGRLCRCIERFVVASGLVVGLLLVQSFKKPMCCSDWVAGVRISNWWFQLAFASILARHGAIPSTASSTEPSAARTSLVPLLALSDETNVRGLGSKLTTGNTPSIILQQHSGVS